ncbi:MAG: cytochrome c [Sinimarinibacterium sp.]|jgi:mono/diheme cytochrome c family protein
MKTNPLLPLAFMVVALASGAATAGAPDGAALFNQTCVACHGKSGQGAIPGVPDMTGKGGPLTKSDAELTASILNGFQTKGSPMAMPTKGGNPKLTAEDAAALVAYLRTLAKK